MIPTSFSPETFDYVVLCTGNGVCVHGVSLSRKQGGGSDDAHCTSVALPSSKLHLQAVATPSVLVNA